MDTLLQQIPQTVDHIHMPRASCHGSVTKIKVIVFKKPSKYVLAFFRYVSRSIFRKKTARQPTAVGGRGRKYSTFFVGSACNYPKNS